MDNSFNRQESDTQQSSGIFAASLQMLAGLLKWLTDLIQMTDEEQEQAGIYIGYQRHK